MANIKLFSLGSNQPLAEEISKTLGIPLANSRVLHFADGEVCTEINETVRGADVYVIHSTSAPVNDRVMELLVMCDALKRASAHSINLVIPYYGYSRMDFIKKARQPIVTKLIASMLEKAGADSAFLMDIHSTQSTGFFNCHVDNLIAQPVFYKYFKEKNLENVVIVSPDHNGTSRARDYAATLNTTIAIIDRRYSEMLGAKEMHIIGDIKDKTCIIVDDMCDTASTMAHAADFLVASGAKEVYAFATHGVLSGDAVMKINESALKELVITNSIDQPESKKSPKITVLSIGDYIGGAIRASLDGKSLSGNYTYKFVNDEDK